MGHEDKVRLFLEEAQRKGISRWNAGPPLFRFAWFLGLPVRPPMFTSFRKNASWYAVFMALLWGTTMFLTSPRTNAAGVLALTCIAILFGLWCGALYGRHYEQMAKELRLGEWEDYGASRAGR